LTDFVGEHNWRAMLARAESKIVRCARQPGETWSVSEGDLHFAQEKAAKTNIYVIHAGSDRTGA
jgi:hypothetical protein